MMLDTHLTMTAIHSKWPVPLQWQLIYHRLSREATTVDVVLLVGWSKSNHYGMIIYFLAQLVEDCGVQRMVISPMFRSAPGHRPVARNLLLGGKLGHKNFRHLNSNNIELNSIIMKHIIQLASELATATVLKNSILKILSVCHESFTD
jgi:hypothetical protein